MTFPFQNLLRYQLQVFGIQYRVTLCAHVLNRFSLLNIVHNYVLHVPFIELSSALNILLQLVQVFFPKERIILYGQVKDTNCIVFADVSTRKIIYPFQNLILGFILKIFLKFRKFKPRYSNKIYSYKRKECNSEIFRLNTFVNFLFSFIGEKINKWLRRFIRFPL